MFRYLVLGLLRDGVAYHGYALMKEYRERSGVSISTGNFYRELQRLVTEGLVQTAPNPPDADARREPYVITDDGAAAFDSWLLSTPTNIGSYDDELSSRAVFIAESRAAIAHALLDRWHEAVWIHGKNLEREREKVLTPPEESRRALSARGILLARRLKHVAADLEFIEELRNACFPPPASSEAPISQAALEELPRDAARPRARSGKAKKPSKKALKRYRATQPLQKAKSRSRKR